MHLRKFKTALLLILPEHKLYLLVFFAIVLGGLAYAGWFFLTQPNLYLEEQINVGATAERVYVLRPENSLAQTFSTTGSSAVAGIAIKYLPSKSDADALLRATLATKDRQVVILERPLAELTNPPRFVFQGDDSQLAQQIPRQWALLKFAPLPMTMETYELTLTASKPVTFPIEPDASIYTGGTIVSSGQTIRGDLSFILFKTQTPRERLVSLLTTESHLFNLFLISAVILIFAVAYQAVSRILAGKPALPATPLLFFLLLAILFSLPLYDDVHHWGDGDWTEVVTHYAAARHSLAAGQFPLWNPYFCGGFPLWANPQTYWPSLTFLFTLFTNDIIGTKLAVTAYGFLGLWGMLLLTRSLNIRYPASLVPPIVYMYSGFFVTHISAGHLLWLTMAWIPFLVHFFLRGLRSGKVAHLALAAFFYLLLIIEGQIYFFLYIGLLLGALSVVTFWAYPANRQKILRSTIIFLILTLGLGAVKLVPTLAFVQQYESELPNIQPLPWQYLKTMFLTQPQAVMTEALPFPWWEMLFYVGYIPLILTGLAAVRGVRHRQRAILFFLCIGVAALAISFLPNRYNPLEYIPVFYQLRSHQRIMLLNVLALSLLAGWGMQSWRHYFSRRVFELLGLVIALVVFFDFSRAAAWPFINAFTIPPFLSKPSPTFIMSESRTDIGYHTVLAGAGALNYCPPHLRLWNSEAQVSNKTDPDYPGEVSSRHGSLAEILSFTPNRLEILARHVPLAGDSILINQKYSPGWYSNGGHAVFSEQGRLAFAIAPADENSVIVLQFLPRSVIIGTVISFLTVIITGSIVWQRRR